MATGYDTTRGFLNVNTLSIDIATFNRWGNPPTSSSSVSPSPGSAIPIITSTKTIDSVHDELGKEAKKAKPNDWEDKVIEYTKVGTQPISDAQLIPESLNTYAKCVVTENAQSADEGKIPYTIPDNNEVCYIKDCFPGACVPGLNNLLDQSAASLKSFFEQTSSTGLFTNPLKGGGGLGQQLMKKNISDTRLQFTAYFNYDLLMFRYIIDFFNDTIANNSSELQTIYNKIDPNDPNDPNDAYTPKDIQIINTVNLNYLWAYLMIFCKESVEQDPYLELEVIQDEYYDMLNQLSQIRFDGFMVNGDGYISNPIFYYRGMTTYYMISADTATFIDTFCDAIYRDMKSGQMFQQDNINLAGGVQYTTSQSMAATCISSIMGKLKSVVCRNADNKDPIKNACMQEITKLMANKKQAPSGWSILKFSGDSSHIVFGEIMGWVKNYYGYGFQIEYLLSERPLAGRLLSAGKTIMMVSTNVFMKNFTGKGSEDKNHRRAAFYITFDKSISYINIIEGLYEKINNVRKNNSLYKKAFASDFFKNLQSLPNDEADFDVKAAYLSNDFITDPNSGNINEYPEMVTLNNFMNEPNTIKFLQAYEVDELTNKLNGITLNFVTLGQDLIGRRLGSIRIGSKSNWSLLISELYNRERNPQYNNIIVQQYDNIRQIMSLSSLLFDKLSEFPDISNDLNEMFKTFKTDSGFNAIFYKMIKAYEKNDAKLNRFEDERISDWLSNKKGESQKIPNSVELIIQDIKQFINDCLKVNNFLTIEKITGGGNGKDDGKGDGKMEELDTIFQSELGKRRDSNNDISNNDINDLQIKRANVTQYSDDELIEESIKFIDNFKLTLTQLMPVNTSLDEKDDTLDEINTLVVDFITWKKGLYPDNSREMKLINKTVGYNSGLYDVFADRILLLSGLLDVNDANFNEVVIDHFDLINNSYREALLPTLDFDNKTWKNIIDSIEKSLISVQTIQKVNELNSILTDPTKRGADIGKVKTTIEREYPLLFNNFNAILSNLINDIAILNTLNLNTLNSKKLVLVGNFQDIIRNIITYVQHYNKIIAKYQLLQPYKEGATRTTIINRLVQAAVTQLGRGGKKTKKRRKISRKKKGHKKTKKRRTIKKNRKN